MCEKCESIKNYNFAEEENICFYTSKRKPDGRYGIVYQSEEGYEVIDIEYCPWCGLKLG